MAHQTLGILILQNEKHCRFAEKNFFEQLSLYAKQNNIRAIVFSPEWVNWDVQTTFGFFFDAKRKKWTETTIPIPKIIYDRCFQFKGINKSQKILQQLRKQSAFLFLNAPLSGKWSIHQLLYQNETLRPFLPTTEKYKNFYQLIHLLERDGKIFLKPINGTHGLGILSISKTSFQAYIIQGRISRNQSIHETVTSNTNLKKRVEQLTSNRPYILQQSLELSTVDGNAFDVRVLVQKDGTGEWKISGSAVRVGKPDSVTSNLHSGGHAKQLLSFLIEHYSTDLTSSIVASIEDVVKLVPRIIEEHHGRLCELGLDFGVDRTGKVWLLEVNSKPGRKIFDLEELKLSKQLSFSRPILYAKYLMLRKIGG